MRTPSIRRGSPRKQSGTARHSNSPGTLSNDSIRFETTEMRQDLHIPRLKQKMESKNQTDTVAVGVALGGCAVGAAGVAQLCRVFRLHVKIVSETVALSNFSEDALLGSQIHSVVVLRRELQGRNRAKSVKHFEPSLVARSRRRRHLS